MRALKSAKSSIHMQIYGLTDPDLIALLGKKQAEGLDIQIFYDKRASARLPLLAYPVKSSGLMHRKILVIDQSQIFIGSANCTPQSLKMHDNLVLGLKDEKMADFFTQSIDSDHIFDLQGQILSAHLLPDFEGKALPDLCDQIDLAKTSIHIAMFTLTHPQIVEKLIAAKKRGVSITIAIDRYTALGASKKSIQQLINAGATVLTSQGSQLLHHKWAWIDKSTFILGSANWTGAAFEKNQDCLLIMKNLAPGHQKTLAKVWKAVEKQSKKG
ncbi:MAG: phosphatidylserine/phosphatidylglycerophosphate/cardiolipin synthase family protein [Simkaniaceae bacterium]|nr:phosphatidylserine/phosphatidylglycerophosphate/cardiolipin synthase family protein [Candidatus Sacchlamyda saccharinae]